MSNCNGICDCGAAYERGRTDGKNEVIAKLLDVAGQVIKSEQNNDDVVTLYLKSTLMYKK